jgi:transcriptional regulator with XRE-family HTH domain
MLKKIGGRIREERNKLGISQLDLALQTKVGVSALVKLERGGGAKLSTLGMLLDYFNLDIDLIAK